MNPVCLKPPKPSSLKNKVKTEHTGSASNQIMWSQYTSDRRAAATSYNKNNLTNAGHRCPVSHDLMSRPCSLAGHRCPVSHDLMSRPCSHTSSHQSLWVDPSLKYQLNKQDAQRKRDNLYMVKLKSLKRRLEESKLREINLITSNTRLRERIEADEQCCHENIKTLLRKYEHLRAGSDNITSIHNDDVIRERRELDERTEITQSALNDLEGEVSELNERLSQTSDYVELIRTYPTKEFHRKSAEIKELETRLSEAKNSLHKEEEEVRRVGEDSLSRLNNIQSQQISTIIHNVTQVIKKQIDRGVFEMVLENVDMKERIEQYAEEIEGLNEEISHLKKDITLLKIDPRRNFQRMVFPEICASPLPKCTPDMEILLDIRVHQQLPM